MNEFESRIINSPALVHLSGRGGVRESDEMTRVSSRNSTRSTLVSTQPFKVRLSIVARESSCFKYASCVSWRGVIAIIAGVCQQSLCWGMIMAFGCILTFYTRHLLPDTSKKALTLVGAIPPFFVLGLSLLWGRLLDAGHHRRVNIFAGICLTAGLTGLAFTGDDGDYRDGRYWLILLASIPIGVGQSCYFLAAPHTAKIWYPNRKGLVVGITSTGAAIGGVLWPLLFTRVTAIYSFRAGIGTLAGLSALLSAFIAYASQPAPSFERRPISQALKLSTWIPTRCFRSRTLTIHTAAMCSVYLGNLTIPFFIEYWAQHRGIGMAEDIAGGVDATTTATNHDTSLTVYLVVIMNASQLPGRLLGSTLSNRFQSRKIHAAACVATITVIAPAWFTATTYPQGCAFAAMFGTMLGVMVSLPADDVADVLGPGRVHLLGQYAGVMYSVASPFVLAGAVIGGALVDCFRVWVAGVWTIGCFGLCAVLITLSLVLPDDTWKFDHSGAGDGSSEQNTVADTLAVGKTIADSPCHAV